MSNSNDESQIMKFLGKHQKTWRIISVLLVLAWGCVIYGFSSQNGVESGGLSQQISYDLADDYNVIFQQNLGESELLGIAQIIEYPIRKAAHMTEYAIFALLLFQMFLSMGFTGRKLYFTTYGTAFVYAGTDELHQLFSNGRSCQFTDVLIDGVGVILMLLIIYGISKIISRHHRKKNENK